MGRDAHAAQPDQHGHRSRRPHLGGRGRALPLAPRAPARGRSHRRARRQRQGRQGRQDVDLRAGGRPRRAARRGRHRQQGRGVAAARPDRLHGRRSQPALRSGRRHARGAAHRLPGQEPRPLAAFGHGRPGRQVDVQPGQHRRDVHRQVGQDVPLVRRLSRRPGRPVQEPARPERSGRQAERRRSHLRRRLHGADERGRHQRRDHRQQLPQQLRAVDQLVRRRLPERQRRPAGLPRQLRDGVRELRLLVERRAAQLAGRSAAGAVDARRPSGGRTTRA